MNFSSNSLALFLLCSHLGVADESGPKPLSTREWNELEQQLRTASLQPSTLLGATAEQIESALKVHQNEAGRLAHLLDRYSVVEPELERLDSLGIWVLTRL